MKVHLPCSFFSLIFLCQLFLPNIILAIPEFSMCSYSNCYMDIVSQRKSKYVGEKEQAQVGRLKSIQISKSIFYIAADTAADNSDQSGGTSPPKGCCKYRKHEQGSWGKKKNYSFDKCKEENREADDDDIRKQSGKWWWDDNC